EPSEFSAVDEETLAAIKAYPDVIASSIERYRFREASQELLNLARLGNKYLADEEPWKLVKTDEARTKTIMFVSLQIASALATLSEPFLPFTSDKLKTILNIHSGDAKNSWTDISSKKVLLPTGHAIGKAELLFSKIEDDAIQSQLDKLITSKLANEAANKKVEPQKETITFEDFSKLDLRVGTILEAEKMPKA